MTIIINTMNNIEYRNKKIAFLKTIDELIADKKYLVAIKAIYNELKLIKNIQNPERENQIQDFIKILELKRSRIQKLKNKNKPQINIINLLDENKHIKSELKIIKKAKKELDDKIKSLKLQIILSKRKDKKVLLQKLNKYEEIKVAKAIHTHRISKEPLVPERSPSRAYASEPLTSKEPLVPELLTGEYNEIDNEEQLRNDLVVNYH